MRGGVGRGLPLSTSMYGSQLNPDVRSQLRLAEVMLNCGFGRDHLVEPEVTLCTIPTSIANRRSQAKTILDPGKWNFIKRGKFWG